MSDIITKPGKHRERNGGVARVNYVERGTGFAFGYDSLDRATAWHCETGRANFGYGIISEWHDPPTAPDGFVVRERDYVAVHGDMVFARNKWSPCVVSVGHTVASYGERFPREQPQCFASPVPAFSVGDTVLVNCPSSKWHQHYGEVTATPCSDECNVRFADGADGFSNHVLTRVTLPAPLPDGYRLLPRNAPASEEVAIVWPGETWMLGQKGWEGWTTERADGQYGYNKPHFFAEPIPAPAPPFSISTHGPGVYETRDGRQAQVTGSRESGRFVWTGYCPRLRSTFMDWQDDGRWTADETSESPHDLVRFVGPLPEKWTPTDEWMEQRDGVTIIYKGIAPIMPLRKWTCGEREQWRAIKVCQ